MEDNKKVFIGFITYGKMTARYLPYFLPSLKLQTFSNCKIIAVDNTDTGDEDNGKYLFQNYPEVKVVRSGVNLGFARAFNLMINEALQAGAEYFLALNPDMIFGPTMLEEMVRAIGANDDIAAVQPKILRWDFGANQKTDLVDSYGLVIDKKHRFFDDGQGLTDRLENNEIKEIFGFTGAAVLLRLEALKDVAFGQEYFDELMFMYKEDCDLSYRLRLAGWRIVLAPKAIAYHDRSAAIVGQSIAAVALNRKNKNKKLKQWSFLNTLILLYKIKKLPFSLRIKLETLCYLIGSVVFAAIFEPYLIKEFASFGWMTPELKEKRKALKIRIGIEEIERFMK